MRLRQDARVGDSDIPNSKHTEYARVMPPRTRATTIAVPLGWASFVHTQKA